MRAATRPGLAVPLVAALAAAAWAGLLLGERGPYARYLHPFDWADVSPLADLCRAIPGGGVAVPALLLAGGWLLMVAAMMLPTVLPLVSAFGRMTAARADRHALLARLVAGYVLAWLAFGLAVALVDRGLHALAERSGWLLANGWAVGAATLAVAGAYQFSRLKYACLDRCRSPLSFVMSHWTGRDAAGDSLRLGLAHGAFCVGCCWSLMLVLFVVGAGSLAWMLALATVMAIEKNAAWGRALARPLGVVLVASAAWIAASNLLPVLS